MYREVRLEVYGANTRVLSLVLPSLPLTPQRPRQADGQLSSLYPPSPSFSSFGLCEALLSSLARQKHPFLLSRLCLNVGDIKIVMPET